MMIFTIIGKIRQMQLIDWKIWTLTGHDSVLISSHTLLYISIATTRENMQI